MLTGYECITWHNNADVFLSLSLYFYILVALFLFADAAMFRQNLTLNLNEPRQANNKFGSLDLRGLSTNNKELNLNLNQGFTTAVDLIDVSIPLERQG